VKQDPAVLDQYADRWALVTGASSGIGEAFAHKLAARGMHLVLSARRGDILGQLADELATRHGTKTEILVGDLSELGEARRTLDEIQAKGIPLELLVNNAGFGVVADFENTNPDDVQRMLRLNVATITELTYRVLPAMLERGHGAIINLASMAGFQPVAYMPAYAASKAYILHFSEALWAEVYDRGVTVMAMCPGVTRTGFFEAAGVPGWLKKQRSQTAEQAVKGALKGLEKRRQYYIPGWRNYLLSQAVRIAPRKMVVRESMKYFRPQPKPDTAEGRVPERAAADSARESESIQ
jgi:short-subunit dehydrogenase